MRVKQYHGHVRRGNLVASGTIKTDGRIGPRGPRGAGHKESVLTLLSAGDATTADLAACLELSAQYLGTLLGDLELEGRIESRKVGKVKVWSLP